MSSVDAMEHLSYYPATISGIGLSLLSALDNAISYLYKNKKIEVFPTGFVSLMEKQMRLDH